MRCQVFLFIMLGCAGTMWADEFSEFRVPKNRVVRSNTTFGLNFERRNSHGPREGEYVKYITQNGYGNLSYFLHCETDKTQIQLVSDMNLHESTESNKSNDVDWFYNYAEKSEYDNQGLGGGARVFPEVTVYPFAKWVGGELSGQMDARYSQNSRSGSSFHTYQSDYYSSASSSYFEYDSENWGQSYTLYTKVGPTIGRIRNVTAVADALVMESRLIAENILNGRLQMQSRQALANLLYQKPNYYYSHQRWERFFWQDVEAIIKNDPAFAGEFGAYAQQRISESYFGSLYRQRGWRINPYAYYRHENTIDHEWQVSQTTTIYEDRTDYDEAESYSRRHRHSDNGYWGLYAEYASPFGLNWQFQISNDLEYSRNDRSGAPQSGRESILNRFGCELDWIMADRWMSEFSLRSTRQYIDDVGDDNYNFGYRNDVASLSIAYLIEDHVEVSLRYEDQYSWQGSREHFNGVGNTVTQDTRTNRIWLDLRYALLGALQ
ncbi:MAG: hypothetical protein IPP40_10000 [bacterium]|nr:hypothetical protein [bacterium]